MQKGEQSLGIETDSCKIFYDLKNDLDLIGNNYLITIGYNIGDKS